MPNIKRQVIALFLVVGMGTCVVNGSDDFGPLRFARKRLSDAGMPCEVNGSPVWIVDAESILNGILQTESREGLPADRVDYYKSLLSESQEALRQTIYDFFFSLELYVSTVLPDHGPCIVPASTDVENLKKSFVGRLMYQVDPYLKVAEIRALMVVVMAANEYSVATHIPDWTSKLNLILHETDEVYGDEYIRGIMSLYLGEENMPLFDNKNRIMYFVLPEESEGTDHICGLEKHVESTLSVFHELGHYLHDVLGFHLSDILSITTIQRNPLTRKLLLQNYESTFLSQPDFRRKLDGLDLEKLMQILMSVIDKYITENPFLGIKSGDLAQYESREQQIDVVLKFLYGIYWGLFVWVNDTELAQVLGIIPSRRGLILNTLCDFKTSCVLGWVPRWGYIDPQQNEVIRNSIQTIDEGESAERKFLLETYDRFVAEAHCLPQEDALRTYCQLMGCAPNAVRSTAPAKK
jgi:hypothetical protein